MRVPSKHPGKTVHRGARAGQVSSRPGGKNPGDVWAFAPVAHNHPEATGHTAQFPEALAERIIAATTAPGEMVCNPYAGSGTVALVAARMNRRFMGAEADPAHHALALARTHGHPVDGVFTNLKALREHAARTGEDPAGLRFALQKGAAATASSTMADEPTRRATMITDLTFEADAPKHHQAPAGSPLRPVIAPPPVGAVLRYPGSKWSLAATIANLLPAHYHYVEPFVGSGAVFFTKEPSVHEVINDIDGAIASFFTVLRTRPDELSWAVATTPWSRSEYQLSCAPATGDSLEDARRLVVRLWQGHAADRSKNAGWSTRGVVQRAAGMSARWTKVPAALEAAADRLLNAEIECAPALDVIARHAGVDTLIYADPPYLPSTRTQKLYAHEMSQDDHVDLLAALNAHPGPVALSGYDSQLYRDALVGWQAVELAATKTHKGVKPVEMLWIKDPGAVAARADDLFDLDVLP